jgi:hypothetical protein
MNAQKRKGSLPEREYRITCRRLVVYLIILASEMTLSLGFALVQMSLSQLDR